MSDPLARLGISREDFVEAMARDGKINAALNEFMEKEIVPFAKGIAPKGKSLAYAASIKVVKKARRGKGRVAATDFKAHWIEFGTGAPGPTDAFATMEKTANHFGGTLDRGAEVEIVIE